MAERFDRRQMLRLAGLATLGGVAAACSTSSHPAAEPSGPAHWGYTGDDGPSHWGALSTDYQACSTGQAQSPIDLRSSDVSGQGGPVALSYTPVRGAAVNNGHTIQVSVDPGCTATIDETAYTLKQFHYHTPAEHTFDGTRKIVEWHFVYQTPDSHAAVLAVVVDPGADNGAFASVLAAAPHTTGSQQVVNGLVEVKAMLPADHTAVRYFPGSLTTPPCTAGEHWVVLTSPASMSPAQIATLQGIINNNSRPLQPLNGRTIQRAVVSI
jgi:carbonic anhydrase